MRQGSPPTPQDSAVTAAALKLVVARFSARADSMQSQIRFALRDCHATVHRASGEPKSFPIQVVDLAFNGLGFDSEIEVAEGALLRIVLDDQELGLDAWSCRVVRCLMQRTGLFRIGATFELTDTNPR